MEWFMCKYCRRTFSGPNLKEHVRKEHPDGKALKPGQIKSMKAVTYQPKKKYVLSPRKGLANLAEKSSSVSIASSTNTVTAVEDSSDDEDCVLTVITSEKGSSSNIAESIPSFASEPVNESGHHVENETSSTDETERSNPEVPRNHGLDFLESPSLAPQSSSDPVASGNSESSSEHPTMGRSIDNSGKSTETNQSDRLIGESIPCCAFGKVETEGQLKGESCASPLSADADADETVSEPGSSKAYIADSISPISSGSPGKRQRLDASEAMERRRIDIIPAINRRYMCHICGPKQLYVTGQGLAAHMKSHSVVVRYVYACSICKQKFSSRKERDAHLEIHSTNDSDDIEVINEFIGKGSMRRKKLKSRSSNGSEDGVSNTTTASMTSSPLLICLDDDD